jgi:hypothetical protein
MLVDVNPEIHTISAMLPGDQSSALAFDTPKVRQAFS